MARSALNFYKAVMQLGDFTSDGQAQAVTLARLFGA